TPRVIKDPNTGAPFPNNVIPQNRLSPNGIGLLNIFPAPNTTRRAQLSTDSVRPSESAQGHRLARLLSKRRALYSIPRAEFRIQPSDSFRQQLPGDSPDLRPSEPNCVGQLHLEHHPDLGERNPRHR